MYRLEKNLEERKYNLEKKGPVPKGGVTVYTEIRKPRRGVLEVPRVWVSEKATETTREATEGERQRGHLRVKGPRLLPRIKRNMNTE